MPRILDDRREKYCQLRVQGHTQSRAHELAGYSGDRSNSSKVESRPDVQGRIRELLAEKEAANPVNVDDLTGAEILKHAAKTAMQTSNLTALVQAGKELAAYDGSGEALDPPDSHDMPPAVLAAQMVPLVRAILWQLMPGKSVPSDQTIHAAILNSVRDSFDNVPAADAAPSTS